METKPIAEIEAHFGKMRAQDWERQTEQVAGHLSDIAICALICEANSWSDIELFGKTSGVTVTLVKCDCPRYRFSLIFSMSLHDKIQQNTI